MMGTRRQQIADATKARLQAIKTGAGYNTNLGQHVFEWKTIPFQAEDMPGCDYRDVKDELTELSPTRHEHRLTMQIEVLFAGSTAPTQMRKLIQDIYTAIGTDPTWGELALHTYPASIESIEIEQAGKKIGGVRLEYQVMYITGKWEL